MGLISHPCRHNSIDQRKSSHGRSLLVGQIIQVKIGRGSEVKSISGRMTSEGYWFVVGNLVNLQNLRFSFLGITFYLNRHICSTQFILWQPRSRIPGPGWSTDIGFLNRLNVSLWHSYFWMRNSNSVRDRKNCKYSPLADSVLKTGGQRPTFTVFDQI